MAAAGASSTTYRGRFAPSPTGPLHFGSLVAAVASYSEALSRGGEWLVRIEDTDPTREVAGSADSILQALDAHGFEFPDPVFQSQRLEVYDAAIRQLLDDGLAFRCSCSRQLLMQTAQRGRAGLIYPGTCRDGADEGERPAISVRLRSAGLHIRFADRLQGPLSCDLEQEIGDFLLRRGDGFVAYQLAVALDDAEQQITEVMRGTDLLDSTFMQLAILAQLGKKSPKYAHVPVVTDSDGIKLSKQSGALAINNNQSNINIFQALSFLLQEPPDALRSASPATLWAWAAENWDPTPLQGLQARPEKSIMVQ